MWEVVESSKISVWITPPFLGEAENSIEPDSPPSKKSKKEQEGKIVFLIDLTFVALSKMGDYPDRCTVRNTMRDAGVTMKIIDSWIMGVSDRAYSSLTDWESWSKDPLTIYILFSV